MFKLVLDRQRNQRSNCQHSLDHWKSKRIPEKHLFLLYWLCQSLWLCSVQFSRSVVSNSLWPHEPQYARPPCPSPTLRVYPNPCPLSRWFHPTISSSVVSFSSCPQSFPASGSFQMSQLFLSDGQSIGVSASAVKSLSCVQLFATPWTVAHHGILQARILEWVAISFSRRSSQSRDWT